MWLEMSRNAAHGGEGWGFTECLWSPTHKNPSGKWSFWELLRRVEKGDTVVHLRGKGQRAAFVGYSIADANGYQTNDRPPMPGQWSYASAFYRVPLTGFVPFLDPISLAQVFKERDTELRQYFAEHKQKQKALQERLFFVVQSGRLQCLNGAYLSEFSDALGSIVLGPIFGGSKSQAVFTAVSARTGDQVAQIRVRLGQEAFSANVRQNYGHRCCFPDCQVAEDALLVGAHIARWSDAKHLRGETSNGLCLCLFHDKAFELGFFTLTPDFRVAVNIAKSGGSPWADRNIAPFEGREVSLGIIKPAAESLQQHWERIGFHQGVNRAGTPGDGMH